MRELPAWTWVNQMQKPIRRGNRYCSKACGYGCTYAAYKKAYTEAVKAKQLLGDDWEIRIWENLGWHWDIRHFPFSMTCEDGKFRALTTDEPTHLGAGNIEWCDNFEHKDPYKVIEHVFKQVKKTAARYKFCEDSIKKILEDKEQHEKGGGE